VPFWGAVSLPAILNRSPPTSIPLRRPLFCNPDFALEIGSGPWAAEKNPLAGVTAQIANADVGRHRRVDWRLLCGPTTDRRVRHVAATHAVAHSHVIFALTIVALTIVALAMVALRMRHAANLGDQVHSLGKARQLVGDVRAGNLRFDARHRPLNFGMIGTQVERVEVSQVTNPRRLISDEKFTAGRQTRQY